MKHEEISMKTKTALAASLKRHMAKKPFRKITVSEIITDCNVNRKTFYYHFSDIYALLKWMLEHEVFKVVENHVPTADYEEIISFGMDYVDANAGILTSAYDSIGREEMKKIFCQDFLEIVRGLINHIEADEGLSVSDDFKDFLTQLFTESMASIIVDRFRRQNMRSREDTINYLMLIIRHSLPEVLRNAPAA